MAKLLFIIYGQQSADHLERMQRQLRKWMESDEAGPAMLNLPESCRLEVIRIDDEGEEVPDVVVKCEPKVAHRPPKWT